ncbi:hypothetical protein KAZ66_00280 [Candidatus Woesebacteria bacterium]|nr:hypothetical protein [Candidatus Woesebacteria bacterium]
MKITKNISDHLNGLIRKMTSGEGKTLYPHTYRTFNGSCVPFIGPEWKTVDFTASFCHIACVSLSNKNGIKKYVGFNQHQQYEHYPYFTITGDAWKAVIDSIMGLYSEVNQKNPDISKVDVQLSKINDYLYEFSSTFEIIEN